MPDGDALVQLPEGVGVGPAAPPSSFLLTRRRGGYMYTGLVDPPSARLTVKEYHVDPVQVAGPAAVRDALYGQLVSDLIRMARAHDVGRLMVYAHPADWQQFLYRGLALEGLLDGFHRADPAYLMAYLLAADRRACGDLEREQAVIEDALALAPESTPRLESASRLVRLTPGDARRLTDLYRTVFETFPTPVDDPHFLARLMASGDGVFLGMERDGHLASAAAAEVDRGRGLAELTNCATRPQFRGEGHMQLLLAELEREMASQRVPALFSIARAVSFGMNRALRRCGFHFRGRLRGHSQICGSFEDMNLWVKVTAPF